jgi:hypothetical protein
VDGQRRARVSLSPEEILDLTSPAPVACSPWLQTERISAAASRDVQRRHGEEPDNRTRAEKARDARGARLRAFETAKANRAAPFNSYA